LTTIILTKKYKAFGKLTFPGHGYFSDLRFLLPWGGRGVGWGGLLGFILSFFNEIFKSIKSTGIQQTKQRSPVLWIRIRMFLGLPDLSLFVFVKKTLIS
jgi:hypothetical protein